MTKSLAFLLSLLLLLSLTACGDSVSSPSSPDIPSAVSVDSSPFSQDDQFTSRDLQADYDPTTATPLTLPASGNTVTLSKEGVYLLSGEGMGQILIDAPTDAKIQLVLDGVTLHHQTSAPIYVKQANKVFVTLAQGSVNTLSCGENFVQTDDNNVDGGIFAKDDLTLNGEGALTISSPGGHGIVCKDDLVIGGGKYTITATGHGISANNSVRVAKGSLTLNSGKDGLKAEHEEDSSLGYVYIQQGDFAITAGWDGISSSGICQIEKGNFTLVTGGGANASASSESTKGIKAGNNLLIAQGNFTVNSCDDALHTNQNATITGGNFTLESGDDGVHADGTLTVTGGEITVSQSYEGLEGHTVTLTGGTHRITASDDGINSAGGTDQSGFGGRGGDQFAVDENAYILISGGHLTIDAGGDGIDSNGALKVGGGETYVYGPVNGGNSAIDGNGTKEITGGILVAVGTAEMAESFDTASQGVALVSLQGTANTHLTLQNDAGETLVSCTPTKQYQCIVISCPAMAEGESYTLTAGSQSTEFTLTDLIYGGGMGGMDGHGNTGGGRPDGQPGGGHRFF